MAKKSKKEIAERDKKLARFMFVMSLPMLAMGISFVLAGDAEITNIFLGYGLVALVSSACTWWEADGKLKLRLGGARARKNRRAKLLLVQMVVFCVVFLPAAFREMTWKLGDILPNLFVFGMLIALVLFAFGMIVREAKEEDCLEVYEMDRCKCGRCGHDWLDDEGCRCLVCGWEKPRDGVEEMG